MNTKRCDSACAMLPLAAIVLLSLSLKMAIASAVDVNKPSRDGKFRPPGFTHVWSESPIPAAHTVCMGFINELMDWQAKSKSIFQTPPNRDKVSDARYRDAVKAFNKTVEFYNKLIETNRIDWGVPTKESAQELLETAESEAKQNEDDLAKSREELSKLIADNSPYLQISMKVRNVYFSEHGVRHNRAFSSYAKCVLKNDLPATVRN